MSTGGRREAVSRSSSRAAAPEDVSHSGMCSTAAPEASVSPYYVAVGRGWWESVADQRGLQGSSVSAGGQKGGWWSDDRPAYGALHL